MDVPTVSKSKLATASLIFVAVPYLVLFLVVLLGVRVEGASSANILFSMLFVGLDFLGFILSIISLFSIKKYHLSGKKTAIVSLIGSIFLPVLYIGLIILVEITSHSPILSP